MLIKVKISELVLYVSETKAGNIYKDFLIAQQCVD